MPRSINIMSEAPMIKSVVKLGEHVRGEDCDDINSVSESRCV
jgi:hypothetical protein